MKNKSFTLRTKFLLLGIILVLVLSGGMGFLFVSMLSTKAHMEHLASVDTVVLNKAHELKLAVVQVQQWLTDISATRGQDGLDDGFKEAENAAHVFQNLLQELQALDRSNAQSYQAMRPSFEAYYAVGQKMAHAYIEQGPSGGNRLMAEFDAVAEELAGHVNRFLAATQQRVVSASAAHAQSLDQQMLMLSILCIIVAGVLLITGWVIRSILRSLLNAITVSNHIAEGDLTTVIQITSQDEIGQLLQAMQTMNANLRRIVGDVTQTTHTVSNAANEIAQGSADLSQRTEKQASSLEETAATMEELTSTVKQSAEHAEQANQLASAACIQAKQGGQIVAQVITAMGAINASSSQIADIIGVIDEIAFQTNLLALNAAVEAARAGEQGRSFAIVAAEVGKLAQRSADAAKKIKGLISDSVGRVKDGNQLVDQTRQTLQEIIATAKKVNDIVAEIATTTHEQATGIEQLNKAMIEIDQVTQQNAALVEQTAAASQLMGEQASELQQLMTFFKLDERLATVARAAARTTSTAKPAVASADNLMNSRKKSGYPVAIRSEAHRPVLKTIG
ncbi:MAG: HAMP domain-containing protein [Gammaproteobacteria bacterium]|nr:HAMP domain-containing protein [Gammaproteobacteria bacterium]